MNSNKMNVYVCNNQKTADLKIKGMALVYTLNFVIDFFVFFQMFHKKGERSKRDHPSIIPIDPPMLPKRT